MPLHIIRQDITKIECGLWQMRRIIRYWVGNVDGAQFIKDQIEQSRGLEEKDD